MPTRTLWLWRAPDGRDGRLTAAMCAGGESTTMALVAERWGLIPELQQFARQGKPVWGTCAGLIFLADRATGELGPQQQGTRTAAPAVSQSGTSQLAVHRPPAGGGLACVERSWRRAPPHTSLQARLGPHV